MDSFLLSKSTNNIDAADYLIKRTLYAPSIHCSYYSCIQLILHLFLTTGVQSDSENDENKLDSHKILFNNLQKYLFLNNKVREGQSLVSDLTLLKGLRVKADYKNINISFEKAKDALAKSKEIQANLYKYFKQ